MGHTEERSATVGQAFAILAIFIFITIPLSLLAGYFLVHNPGCKSLISLVSYIAQLLLTIIIARQFFSIKSIDTAAVRPKIYIISFFGLYAMSTMAELIISQIPMPDMIKQLFENAITLDFAGYLTVGVAAPILEEILFRGIILSLLLKRYNPQKAILWSALIFGIAHLNPWQFIAAFMIGYAIGWLFYNTKSIWIGIFIHWVNNSTGFMIGYITNDINTSVTDWINGPLYQILTFTACATIIMCIYKVLKKEFSKP